MLEIGDYDVRSLLGKGMNCQAYYVMNDKIGCVAKLFDAEKSEALNTEKAMLQLFAEYDMKNVPKLVEECSTTVGSTALIVTPVGKVVRPLSGGAVIRGHQLAPLVTLLERIHKELKKAHRDIKPGRYLRSM
jgi:hypothetical protein